jgi:AhpD family alkylhydroperoxidase
MYAALSGVSKAVTAAGMDSADRAVKLRVSQINGCAFCLQFHLNIARKLDIDPRKFDLLAGWRDAGIYTARETAALGWAEALTRMTDGPARDAALAGARRVQRRGTGVPGRHDCVDQRLEPYRRRPALSAAARRCRPERADASPPRSKSDSSHRHAGRRRGILCADAPASSASGQRGRIGHALAAPDAGRLPAGRPVARRPVVALAGYRLAENLVYGQYCMSTTS